MASDFLPPDDPILDPDDDLSSAESLLDDIVSADLVAQPAPPPIGRSWYFDFPSKTFTKNGDTPLSTYGQDTLNSWVEKAMRTARGAHPIYPSDYGIVDPYGIIGTTPTSADYAVLEGNIRDALTFHPRIVDVTDFSASQDPNDEAVLVSFTFVLDDGTERAAFNLPVG